ncbi:MAG: hypothetical protein ABSD42_09120 [Candidatus Bathyarchaeia archaeon]
MTQEEEQLKKIEAILLKHTGEKKAIYARKIAKQVGIRDNDTFVNTRMLIRKLMKQKQLPIGATANRGYFIIENQKELNDYVKDLNRRLIGITNRKAYAIRYFETYYKQAFKEPEEVEEEEDEEDII